MTHPSENESPDDHERVADQDIRHLLDRYVALAGATMSELAPNLFQLAVPASDRSAFGRRSVVRIAFSVEAMQEDERAEIAIVGSPFAAQLISAIRRRGDRHLVGRVTPGERDLSSAPPPPVPIRNGSVTTSEIAVRRHRVGRLTARIVIRAGADVREHLAESVLVDLCSGLALNDDISRACSAASDSAGLANRSSVWESLEASATVPIADLVPRMLSSLEDRLRPEIEQLEAESQRALAHELGRIERYYRSLAEDLGGRGTEVSSKDARAAYQAEHARRKKEETDRHQVRATVHPLQLEEFEVLVQSADWAIEGPGALVGRLSAQRMLAGGNVWALCCPNCSSPLREGVLCKSNHLACDLCSLGCSVCNQEFCRGHGLAACHIDSAPVCTEHARTCGSCHEAHCSRHEGICDDTGHAACTTCLAACAHCGRIICNHHATNSDAESPRGSRRLCAQCVRYCEGGTGEVVGPDEVAGCDSCARVVCGRHQAHCDVDKRVHCSKHLRRTDRSRRLVCEKDRAKCSLEPNAVFAIDEIFSCATCATNVCDTHSAICVVDGLRHCSTHVSVVKDRPGASACVPHQSHCHVDNVAFTLAGTATCACCGKATCADHFRECGNCGRRLCIKDFAFSSPKTCATCAKLSDATEIADDILEAAMTARGGESGRPKRWRLARDAGHRVVEMDMGWTRRLVMSVPHDASRPDSVISHSIFARTRVRPR